MWRRERERESERGKIITECACVRKEGEKYKKERYSMSERDKVCEIDIQWVRERGRKEKVFFVSLDVRERERGGERERGEREDEMTD